MQTNIFKPENNTPSKAKPNTMQPAFILLFLLSVLFNAKTTTANSFYPDRMYIMKARNQYLRFYIFHKKDDLKAVLVIAKDKIQEKTNRLYNYVLSKYYDSQAMYYSLPEEDRQIIEQIINLHF